MTKPSQKQGQILAYIYYYTKINRRPPAEADIAAYFGITGPSTHQMVIRLEDGGFIARTPGAARSVQILLPASALPALE
ncbi:MAG: transcriptional regulator [Elusimicrobia bacterium RBG_16_66_12]|nr:MAG: transcriptional regulator [Elusimicrobia bacterium RBG_16_66_12]